MEDLIEILCPQKYKNSNECNYHQCPMQIMNNKNGEIKELRACHYGKFKVTWTEHIIYKKYLIKDK